MSLIDTVIGAPGVNATNPASFAFPSELSGVYSGNGKNWIPGTPEYEVYLRIDGCDAFGDTCGIAAYPPLFGRLSYLAPVDCVNYLSGDAPTGRCYGFAEDFIGADELEPPFWYSYIMLSEQEDATFFWTFMQGPIATAWGSIAPVFDDIELSTPSTALSPFVSDRATTLSYLSNITAEALDSNNLSPLGSLFSLIPRFNNVPASMAGSWTSGTVENFIGDVGAEIEITVDSAGCSQLDFMNFDREEMTTDWCATIQLPAVDQEPRAMGYVMRNECIASISGPDPSGTCYMFLSLDPEELQSDWDGDSLGFYALSAQRDGGLWWSWTYGPVVKAAGLLARN
jgi:hypothetical protein